MPYARIILILLFVGNTLLLPAQTKIVDSIRASLYATKDNSRKLNALLGLSDQYQSLSRDSAYDYALLALQLSSQTNNIRNKARAELAFANAYYLWGWVDSASAVCDNALKKYKIDDAATRDVYFKLLRQKAICYGGVQKLPEALDLLYRLLRESEQYKDSITIASTCNTIGSININMSKANEALSWVLRALNYDTKDEKFIAIKAAIFTNAANIYMAKNNNDSAMHYINKALPFCYEAQNLNTLATALRIRSNIFANAHKYTEAENDLRQMQEIRRKLNGNSSSNIIEDNLQIANFYANTGQLNKAIAFCKDHIKNGDVYTTGDTVSYNNHISNKIEFYQLLASLYKQAGMRTEYESTLEEIIAAKDSFYAANNAQVIAEVQTKYETEQKEKTILQQRYDLTKKNFIIYGSLVLLLLSGIIFYLVFRDYRRKQKIKMQLAMEEEQSAKQVAIKKAEEKERKRIAADLHDNLGVQANAILYNTELLKNETENSGVLVDNLHDTAKQMLLNLRETLWAMKTNDIETAELWLRIISFSKQMGRHYTQIHFATQGMAPVEMLLSSSKALNIVLMVQEAVQNAVKHSNANEIIILSNNINDTWQLEVKDNGTGFSFNDAYAKKESHGLKNMQERAAASDIDLNVYCDNGTIVELLILDKK